MLSDTVAAAERERLANKIADLIISRMETEGCDDGIGTLSDEDCKRLGKDIAQLVQAENAGNQS